jgi:allantoin racemase
VTVVRIVYVVPGPMSRTKLGAEEVARRGRRLRAWAAAGVEVDIRDVPRGPASIESAYEEYLAVPATAEAMLAAEADGYDAAILGCFGDPGIDGLRELLTRMVVVAPGEAAAHLAAMLGESFGIITVTQSIVHPLRHLMARVGLAGRLAGVAVVETPVLELADDPAATLERVVAAGRALIERQGADTLVLGCMTMAFLGIAPQVESALGVPVVNPPLAALKLAEALVGAGLRHSKRAYPLPPKLAAGRVRHAADLYLHNPSETRC